jgi:AraC-like DNA-binding protein
MTVHSLRSERPTEQILLERLVVFPDGPGGACPVSSARNSCVVIAVEAVTDGSAPLGPVRGRAAMLRHTPTTQPSALASAVLAVVTAVIATPPEPGTPSAIALEQSVLQLCRGLLAADADERRRPEEPSAPRFIALRDTVARLGVGGRVTIDAVAAELGTSTADVRFALASGNTTFSGLLRECRLVALAERIRTDGSDAALTRLPGEVGIASYPQAARAFKARFGMTMGEYRRFVRL